MKILTLAFLLSSAPATVAGGPGFDTELPATDQQSYSLKALVTRAPVTVVEFFSAGCPCQAAHDARLLALAEKYRAQGVQVILVDSNYSAAAGADGAEAKKRGYPFPIVLDPKGLWIEALGAKYATYSVVLDATGKIRYRGGFDSDRHPATDHAKPYLDDAVAAVLVGHEPNPAETRSLGCVLERW